MVDRRLRRTARAIVVSTIGLGLILVVFRGPGHAADRDEGRGGDATRHWLRAETWPDAVRERATHLAAESRIGAALVTLRPLMATSFATEEDRALQRLWEARLRTHPLLRFRTNPPAPIDPALSPRLTISVHDDGLSVEESRLEVVTRGEPVRDGSTTRRTVTSLALGEHRDWLRSRLDAPSVLPADPFVAQLEARRRDLTERQYRRARVRSRDVAEWEEVPVFVSPTHLATEVGRRARYVIRVDVLHADGRFEQFLAAAERAEVDRMADGSVSAGRPADLLEFTPLADVERALRVQAEAKRDSVIASLRRQLEASIEREIERLEAERDWDAARDLAARLAFERARLTAVDEAPAAVSVVRDR